MADPSSPGDFDKHETKLESIMDDEVLNFFRKEQKNDRGGVPVHLRHDVEGGD